MAEIREWKDIKAQFTHGLLLGNGASISVHPGFGYGSLYEEAQRHEYLTPEVAAVFKAFGIEDFELVLRRLWHAKVVNQKLEIPSGPVEEAYRQVRTALISTVRKVHISHEDAKPSLTPIYRFMSGFETVVSLNYDLLVYWALMQGMNEYPGRFKDCFYNRQFLENWEEWREPIGRTTLVFYPHGNLSLCRGIDQQESKLSAAPGQDLLTKILAVWERGARVPLFVCEGTAEHKLKSIGTSAYLQRVYSEVLPKLGESLVIYGWGMGEQEKHILQKLRHARCRRVAVSVHGGNTESVRHAEQRLQSMGVEEIVFFNSASPGCWNNLVADKPPLA